MLLSLILIGSCLGKSWQETQIIDPLAADSTCAQSVSWRSKQSLLLSLLLSPDSTCASKAMQLDGLLAAGSWGRSIIYLTHANRVAPHRNFPACSTGLISSTDVLLIKPGCNHKPEFALSRQDSGTFAESRQRGVFRTASASRKDIAPIDVSGRACIEKHRTCIKSSFETLCA